MNLEQMLDILGRLFTVSTRWNPDLKCWQAGGKCIGENMNIRNNPYEQIVSPCLGSGPKVEDAVTDLWNKLTGLPEDGRVRVSQYFHVWIEYHWNGKEFVEVQRQGC